MLVRLQQVILRMFDIRCMQIKAKLFHFFCLGVVGGDRFVFVDLMKKLRRWDVEVQKKNLK